MGFKKGYIPWNKGKKTGLIPKSAFKKGCKSWIKGKHIKINNALELYYKKGGLPWNKGKQRPEMMGEKNPAKRLEVRKKIRLSKIGKNNPSWQGGISFEPYSTDWTETLKRSIRERDNYICQFCSQYGWIVHHIDYNKKNCNPDNLITLCKKCHNKTNLNRAYWLKYFKTCKKIT